MRNTTGYRGFCLDKIDLVPILGRFPFLLPPLRSICILAPDCFIPWLRFLLKEFKKLLLSINYPCHPSEIAQTPSTAPCLLYIYLNLLRDLPFTPSFSFFYFVFTILSIIFQLPLSLGPSLSPGPRVRHPSRPCWKPSFSEPAHFYAFVLVLHVGL